MLTTDLEKVNAIITTHTAAAVPALVAEQNKYGITHGPNGFNKIRTAMRKRDGMINKVTFKFPKTGIYREKGAGRGYGGKKGSKWIDANGVTKTTNPASLGKAGTGKRQAAPWFNPVIEKYADQMANELADQFVEIAFNNLLIK